MARPTADALHEAASLLRAAADEVRAVAPDDEWYGDAPLAPAVAAFRDAWLPALERESELLARTGRWTAAAQRPDGTT